MLEAQGQHRPRCPCLVWAETLWDIHTLEVVLFVVVVVGELEVLQGVVRC